MDNTLLDLQNSSYPTQPDSIFANYFLMSIFLVVPAGSGWVPAVSGSSGQVPCAFCALYTPVKNG